MSYIDSINESIKHVEQEIKHLQKVKAQYKKDKQRYCPHHNLIRYTKMPRLSYTVAIDQYSPMDTIKVKTKCKDCGKVLS